MQHTNPPQTTINSNIRDASVQISRKHASAHNPKPWVIVENPGTDNENIVIDFATYREACRWIDRNYTDDDCPADILRRLDDGTLTTEY